MPDLGIGETIASLTASTAAEAGTAGATDAALSSTAYAGSTAASASLGPGTAAAAGGTVGTTGLAISATGAGAQGYGTIMGAAAQGRMARLQGQATQLRAARDRINMVREARIKTAMITQSAANSGTTGSSASAGGTGSVTSQLGSNLSFQNQQLQIGQGMTNAYQSIASAEGVEAIGGGLIKTGGTIFQNRDQVNDIFRS